MWPFGSWYGGGWWFSPFHGLSSLLFLALVIWAVVVLGRGRSGRLGPRSSAIEALDERYARGEIQREEYLQKKHDLGA